MRSVERLPPIGLKQTLCAVAVAALLSGCGSVGMRLRSALPGASASAPASSPAQAASAAAPQAAASAIAAPKPASTGPIAPATQRAYDDALALMRAGHAADAERGLRALTRSDPDLAGPHANLGLLARQADRPPEAVTELETPTTLAPGLAVAWNQLGLAYRQSGEFTKAHAAYDSALAIDPNYATAVLNLGVLEDLYLGDSASALELYTRYLALTPAGDPVVTKWIADVKNRKPAGAASAPVPASATKEKS
jgi:tetratricopeptide (TPR) repeat protein